MGQLVATMFTFTTYGTWLRGDERGWVDEGRVFPPNPELESADRERMQFTAHLFAQEVVSRVGQFIGDSLRSRLKQHIWAMTVQEWHVHVVVGASQTPISAIAKCAKDAVRWGFESIARSGLTATTSDSATIRSPSGIASGTSNSTIWTEACPQSPGRSSRPRRFRRRGQPDPRN